MSLAIDPDLVAKVLLPDGWYTIEQGTFDVDAYEIIHKWENPPGHEKSMILHGGGTGFMFRCAGSRIYGPMQSIQAIRYATTEEDHP